MDRILKSEVEFVGPPVEGWNMASEFLTAFERHSQRVLLVDAANKRSWTGGQMLKSAGSIASGLIKQVALRPGQVVFMACDHSDEEILLAMGAILAGGAFFGATPQDGLSELKTLCKLVRPSVLVTNSRLHQTMVELRREVAGLESVPIIWIDNPCKVGTEQVDQNGNDCNNNNNNNNNNDDSGYWADMVQRDNVVLAGDLSGEPFDETLVKQVAAERIDARAQNLTYMLTSGSTGRPKVVASTHEELIYGLYSMISASQSARGAHGRPQDHLILPVGKDSILAGDLPLDHGAGLNTMLLSFSLGAKFIVMPSYEEDTFWRAVHDYRISSSIASTTFSFKLLTHLKALIDAGKHSKQFDLSCFRYLTCVGSKMAFGELVHEINQTYDQLRVCQGYGCTEVGFMSMLRQVDCRKHLNSVGHLFPGIVAKVVDRDSGQVVGAGERGELHVWARSKFKQYKCHQEDNPVKLLEACHDAEGFYKTGDQVHYDHEGRLYVHGRFKDTLFLGQDWKILPSELEEIVDKHPLVEQSAVIGVPDRQLPGCDAPRAFVKLISASQASSTLQDEPEELRRKFELRDEEFISEHIYKFVAQQTATEKHLKGGVKILEEFPKVGLLNKIDRKALRLMSK